MNATAVALLGLTLGQPPAPAPDYYPFNSRTLRLPIEYKTDRAQVQRVQLFVSRDVGATWTCEADGTPDKTEFVYVARDDGMYWFHIVTVDMRGKKDPPDITREAPALKVLVDTQKPVIQFAEGKRNGQEVVAEWDVKDRFPNPAATQVFFQPGGSPQGYWQPVTLPPGSTNGVRFPSATTGPVVVKVVATDLAGNVTEAVKDYAAVAAPPSTSMSPGSAGGPPAAAVPAPGGAGMGAGPILPLPAPVGLPPGPAAPPAVPPPDLFGQPAAPAAPPNPPPAPATNPGIITPPSPPIGTAPPAVGLAPQPAAMPPAVIASQPPAAAPNPPPVVMTPAAPSGPQPVPAFDPRNPVTQVGAAGTAGAGGYGAPPAALPGGNPLPAAAGTSAVGAAVDAPRATVVGSLRFELAYQVEQRGPSGISRVDLWVTRDDGRSWVRWSEHDGRDPNVKVNLDVRVNTQPEGLYGFRLVPVSGAGLSEGTPNPGDAPDMRVVVDVTRPDLKILQPGSDPADPTALVLQWEAADRNFGDEPITLEWSRDLTGPWYPVAAADGVVQAQAVGGAVRRLPNTGRYAWRVPTGLPPRVYLKVTARDAAGNTAEQVTREPLLIDLARPRAKITGLGTAPVVPRP